MAKAALKADAWLRDLAPSTALRKWYGHDPARLAEFRRRYRDELAARGDELAQLRQMVEGRPATLVTATRDLALSHAQVEISYDVLSGRGNVGTPSIFYVLHETIKRRNPRHGEHGLMVTVGPGVTVGLMLLVF